MTGLVPELARAEIPPVTPVVVMKTLLERPLRGGTEPQVIIQLRRRRRDIGAEGRTRAIVPDVDFAHPADPPLPPGLDDLDHAVVILDGVNLNPHLRDEFGLLCQLDD